MLKSIRLQNFFGFQDCTINLEKGVNVLVGINGSGKSNFFKAVKLLKELVTDNELKNVLYKEFGGIQNVIFSDKSDKSSTVLKSMSINVRFDVTNTSNINTDFAISITPDTSGGHFIETEDYSTTRISNNQILEQIQREYEHVAVKKYIGGKAQSPNNYQVALNSSFLNRAAREITGREEVSTYRLELLLNDIKIYNGFDTNRNSPLRNPNPPSLDKSLLIDGGNLASLLNSFKISNKSTYNLILFALKRVNEKYNSIEFNQASPGFLDLWLDEEGLNKAIPSLHISDGTLKFLCLMAILYNPNRGSVVCIDEPELGLHPDMINTLHEAIEFASQTSQVIISTHSAHLLDYFELKQIRIFEKDENNATIVNQVTKDDFEGWYETFNPGQMWRAGDFGGNRY